MPLKPTIPYRNKIGPQSDRLMVHFGVDEGSGTDLLNLAPARNGMGDATISGGDWGSDADGALYDFGAGGGSGYAAFTAPGSDQLFPEWTLSIVFDDIGDNSVNRPLFTSSYNSTLATTHGMILCQVIPSGDTLRVSVRDSNGAVTRTLDWAGITRSAVNHLILSGGGQAGVTGTLNGSAPTAQGNTPTAYQGAMRTVTSRSFTLGRNSTPDYGNYKLKAFDLWNVRLTASEIDEIYDDPYLMGREPPGMGVEIAAATDRLDTTAYTVGQVRRFAADSPYIYECTTAGTSGGSVPGEATYDTQARSDGGGTLVWAARVASLFSSWAVPWVGRADTDRVTFRFQTSRWLQSASVYVRVRMATTRAGLAGATPTTSAQVTTGSTVIDLVPTGLSAGTFYYTAFDWSVDNSAWYPFPCGYGTVTTRKTSGNITPATYSDCHINVGTGGVCPSDIGWGSDIVYNEADYTINAIGYRNRFACWKSASHIAAQTAPTFMLWVGDHFMFDSDTTAGTADDTSDMWQRARSMMCFYARMLKRQCNFIALGNHEGTCGHYQLDNSGAKATQKQSFNAFRKHVANPTSTTYAHGGEAANSTADWVNPLSPASYIHDTALELNNYFGFTWGDADFFVLDYCRYSDPGGPSDEYRDEPNLFTTGNVQYNWLRSRLAASTKAMKIVACHAMPGGVSMGQTFDGGYYSRDAATSLNRVEPFLSLGVSEANSERNLHTLFRGYGVTVFLKGHDHKAAVVPRDGVYYVTCPTAGAPSHTQAAYPGWNQNSNDGTEWTEIQNSYGTAQSLGQLDASGGDLTLRGMLKHYNTMGYWAFSLTGGSLSSLLWQTVIQTIGTSESDLEKYILPFESGSGRGYAERFLANQASTPSSRAVNLATGDALNATPRPTQIAIAGLASSITGAWYETLSVDQHGGRSPAAWSALATLAVGDFRVPTVANGYLYMVSAITTGTTGATEPTQSGTAATDWPTTIGATVVDAGVTWICAQRFFENYQFDERVGSSTIYVKTASDVQVSYAPRVLMSQSYTTKAAEPSVLGSVGKKESSAAMRVYYEYWKL